jgi:prepilin-type processing-associated H-X9-DG protein
VVGGAVSVNSNMPAGTPSPVTNTSYGANNFIFYGASNNPSNCNSNWGGTIPVLEMQINYPSEMFGIIDAAAGCPVAEIPTVAGCGWAHSTTYASVLSSLTTDSTQNTARHNQGSNLSFMDGHAKWMPVVGFPDPTNLTVGALSPGGINIRHFWYGID